ncbi:MAG TPA: hypothetical protein VJB12_04855 [Candidatus Nanoarchaeia archaeon]|nr:hypothetical protein [Candidatus Nanoarchaeia archaeon]
MGKKGHTTIICPNCASIKVHADLSKEMIAWGGSTRYICDDCGHSAVIFPSVPFSQVAYFKKAVKNRKTDKKSSSPSANVLPVKSNRIFLGYTLVFLLAFIISGYYLMDSLTFFIGAGFLIPIVIIIIFSRIAGNRDK